MRIDEDLYLIGSGNFGISHPTDCNIYLIDAGESCLLVDAGSGVDPERLLENIKREGIPLRRIEYVVLTHAHWDHAGGCADVARALSCTICAHPLSVPLLEEASRGGWLRTPIHVGLRAEDGTVLQVGNKELQFIHSPGHSPDGLCVRCRLACGVGLLCGDTVLANGRIGVISSETSLGEYARTIESLARLRPDALLPGYGVFTLSNAQAHLALSMRLVKSNWCDVLAGPTPFNPSWWRKYLQENT